MIRYALHCDNDHAFDSWFHSVGAFDRLVAARQVECPICASPKVSKALMSPAVPSAAAGVAHPAATLSAPGNDREAKLAALRQELAEKSEYVGMRFVTEARRIHDGAAPERAIHGEARIDEAIKLIEDGVPVAPLPFLPTRKLN